MNPQKVAKDVSLYFGVEFLGENVQLDGGIFPCIRPVDLEKGNGFCLVFSKTTKFLEGSFQLDRFGGPILRKMQNAEDHQFDLFNEILSDSVEKGYTFELIINSNKLLSLSKHESSSWSTLELSITIRYQNGDLDTLFKSLVITLVSLSLSLLPIQEDNSFFISGELEGAKKLRLTSVYERSPVNRARCLEYHGLSCKICGFNFEKIYGELGNGFIEVHHIVPVSTIGANVKLNPIEDLIPLCSNCHSMIHRKIPPLTPPELINIISDKTS